MHPTAPAVLGVNVNGTGYTSDIFRDLVSAFGVLQQGNISVLSQRCILQPVEPDYSTYISMGDWGCCTLSVLGSGGRVQGGSPLRDSSSSHQESCMASASSSLSLAAMWHACAGQCVPPITHAASR